MIESHYYSPTLQTKFDGEGNCLSAVIATMFDVGIDDIPVFEDGDNWASDLTTWMSGRFGKIAVQVKLPPEEETLLFNDSLVITTINSNNSMVERHAVISRGDKIIFDPMVGDVDIEITEEMEPTYILIGDMRTKGLRV